MNAPIYILDSAELTGLSLVNHPAIKAPFQLFSEQQEKEYFSLDNDKHVVFGPALIANKPIYRRRADGSEYYIMFTPEVIEDMVICFFRSGQNLLIDLEHNMKPTDGVTLFQSYITHYDSDICPDIPAGSWFVGLKIDNPEVWQNIKEGKFHGFSIEATINYDQNNVVKPTEPDPIDEAINNILD